MGNRVDETCLNRTLDLNHDILISKDSNIKGEESLAKDLPAPADS